MNDARLLFSIDEISCLFSVPKRWLIRKVRDGHTPASRAVDRFLFSPNEVEEAESEPVAGTTTYGGDQVQTTQTSQATKGEWD